MRRFNLLNLSLILASVCSVVLMTGCSSYAGTSVYQSYYQDKECRVYYMDNMGNRVYLSNRPVYVNGGTMMKDGGSTGDYVTNTGDHVYKSRMCHGSMYKDCWK